MTGKREDLIERDPNFFNTIMLFPYYNIAKPNLKIGKSIYSTFPITKHLKLQE
jgi:hypothetical protein